MTTPLIRSTMRYCAEVGIDPTELHWFDATGGFKDRSEISQDPLHTMRPPFEKCMVVWSGVGRSGIPMEMHMTTAGSDPEEGIIVSVWRVPARSKPVRSPLMLYAVDGRMVRYGPVDEGETIKEDEAQMILGFVSAWLASLNRRGEAYVPSVAKTFTNQRKIAQGKTPTYDWHTVAIEPAQAKRESQGGTHASPRAHDRRGHLRRLRSGKIVWVRDCRVGNAALGAVFKDYEVKYD